MYWYDHLFRAFEETLVPLAWPMIVGFAFIWFKEPISTAIENFKITFGKNKSVEVSTPPKRQIERINKLEEIDGISHDPGSPSKLTPLQADPELTSWEDNIKKLLNDNSVTDKDEINERLLRATAQLTRDAYIQTLSNNIYGTQFGALIDLVKFGPHTKPTLLHWYSSHEKRAGNAAYLTFEEWLNYPIRNQLVVQTGDEFAATDFGKRLAAMMRQRGVNPEDGY